MMQANTPTGPELRDIHMPPPPPWWPLAPGWWILITLVIVLIAASWWLWRRQRKRQSWRQQWLARVDAMAAMHAGDSAALAAALHRLLRQVVRLYAPGAMQARGQAWRHALAEIPVTNDVLDTLMQLDAAMYRPAEGADVAAMVAATKRWLAVAVDQRVVRRARRRLAHV